MWTNEQRSQYMRRFALPASDVELLLEYNAVNFHLPPLPEPADEPFIAAWRGAPADNLPLVNWLNARFALPGTEFVDPDGLSLELREGSAGAIPMLNIRTRADFVSLVRGIFAAKGLKSVPDSVGGMSVRGWKSRIGENNRAILLSQGAYSAVSADAMQLTPEDWLSKSCIIRREHEYAHYWMLRRLGAMQNKLLDELIADAVGITAAFGKYSAAHFQRFIGIENYPEFHTCGRLGSYLPREAELSPNWFKCLMQLARDSSDNLEAALRGREIRGERLITALAGNCIEQLAAGDFELPP